MKGIILAGGKSRRFGEDKALVLWQGTTFIERIVRAVRQLNLDPVIVANRNYPIDCRIEKDLVPDRGPLGGLFTACSLFPSDSLLVLTCDMPFVRLDLLKKLISAHERKNLLTVFSDVQNGLNPFPGVYEGNIRNFIQLRLEIGELSMTDLVREIEPKVLVETRFSLPDFGNINTKEEFQRFIQRREIII